MAGENFGEVTLGTGVLKVNNVDVGIIKGNCTFGYKLDILKLKTGQPLSQKGQKVREITATFKAGLAQLSADTVGYVMGGLTPTTVAGTETSVSKEAHTFAALDFLPGVEGIKLGNQDQLTQWCEISDGADVPVITNTAENVTYTENDDYIVDYENGYVIRNPGGAIGSGGAVKVTYKYTPPASKRFDLGASFSQGTISIEFTHTRDTGEDVVVYMHKAAAKGECVLDFQEDNWNIQNLEVESVWDSTHASNPLGYLIIEDLT